MFELALARRNGSMSLCRPLSSSSKERRYKTYTPFTVPDPRVESCRLIERKGRVGKGKSGKRKGKRQKEDEKVTEGKLDK